MTRQPPGNARSVAARTLLAVLDGRRNGSDETFNLPDPEDRDRAFARHLVYGVLRWLNALQWLAGQLLNRPLKPRDRDVEYLILIGIFQLWKGGTAPHAAVHETAGAARALGKAWAAGLVNAVLRNFQRGEDRLLRELGQREERFAHPDWLLQQLRSDWPSAWSGVVEANNRQPPLWLRVNARKCSTAHYLEMLEDAGLSGRKATGSADALLIEPAVPVGKLPGFHDGQVSVQDAAAQLAAHYLDVQPGQRVLDACAAPGGKSCHLLERNTDIELLALDRDAERLDLVRENLERLGLQAMVMQGDAIDPESWWDGLPFDRILLDAPCSATGVIRRHPEIKWMRDPAQVESAAGQQAALLDALWPLLKPGGMLVYATCSVLKRENSQQISEFRKRHEEAVSMPIDGAPENGTPGRQILPGEQDMDGFYYARLYKPA